MSLLISNALLITFFFNSTP